MKATLVGGPGDGREVYTDSGLLVVPYFDEDLNIVTDYDTAMADLPSSIIGLKNAQYTRHRWACVEPHVLVPGPDGTTEWTDGSTLLGEIVEPIMWNVPGYDVQHLDELLPPFRKRWKVEVTLWLCEEERKDAIGDQGNVAASALQSYLQALYVQSVDPVAKRLVRDARRIARGDFRRLAALMSPGYGKEGTR